MDRINEHHRVDRIQGAVLPLGHALKHFVGNGGDRGLRDHGAIDISQVRADVPVGHASGREGEHDVLDAAQAALTLLHDDRLKASRPVPGHVDLNRPALGGHRLRAVAVTGVATGGAATLVLLLAEVIGDLAVQSGLDNELGQLGQQSVLPVDAKTILTGLTHQLGNEFLINLRAPSPK